MVVGLDVDASSGAEAARRTGLAMMYIMVYLPAMSKRYSIAEARASLATIVDQVEAGADVELTRRGKPVAVVVSLEEYARLHGGRPSFADAYRRFLEKHSLEEMGVDRDFFEGLRDRSPGRPVRLR